MSAHITPVADLVARAVQEIVTLDVPAARALHDAQDGDGNGDEQALFVDIRDIRELWRDGMIPGALHAPRGMLEFWIDPESPYHKPAFSSGRQIVLYCASGWRSALAAKAMQDMGLKPVAHLGGGITAWREQGGAIEPVSPKD